MSKPVDVAEAYRRATPVGGGTMGDLIGEITKIEGSPSLDELFRDKGTRNRFNIGPREAARQMEEKIRNGRR